MHMATGRSQRPRHDTPSTVAPSIFFNCSVSGFAPFKWHDMSRQTCTSTRGGLFHSARKCGKKVWYLFIDEHFPVDDWEVEPDDVRELQRAVVADSKMVVLDEAVHESVPYDFQRLGPVVREWFRERLR